MRYREVVLAVFVSVAPPLWPGRACAQADSPAKAPEAKKTISVTASRPVAKAMDVIEKRYGVPIDYTAPIYASTMDTQLLYSLHGRRLTSPLLIPKVRTISVRYEEVKGSPKGIPYLSCKEQSLVCTPVNAWPKHGITALIQKVLDSLAAQGGQIFAVRKVRMTRGPWYEVGPRWEVYPVRARNALGTFVPQPDLLGAVVHIPAEQRTLYQMLDLIAQQLTLKWGGRFWVASTQPWGNDVGLPPQKSKLGAEGVTAREAILRLLDPGDALRMLGGGMGGDPDYAINVVSLPYREPPRPPAPLAVPARVVPAHPYYPFTWLEVSHTAKGIRDIQRALSKAGYLHTTPTTKWDANAVDALRHFQTANGLRPSGTFDIRTAGKLLPYLPEVPAHMAAARPAMDPALAHWLGNTTDGRKEITEALTKAGFYKGPIGGSANNPKAAAALKAFQKANGLRPTGYFDYATAEKLAPFLPKSKE